MRDGQRAIVGIGVPLVLQKAQAEAVEEQVDAGRGYISQRQATPVTMPETANGKIKMVRKIASPLIFWSSRTAMMKPKRMHWLMNATA